MDIIKYILLGFLCGITISVLMVGYAIIHTSQVPQIKNIGNNESIWIIIDPVGDRFIGEKFTIIANTSLPKNTVVQFSIYRDTPRHTSQTIPIGCDATSGATGLVKISKSNERWNLTAFDVDTMDFCAGNYFIDATVELTGNATLVNSTKFQILK